MKENQKRNPKKYYRYGIIIVIILLLIGTSATLVIKHYQSSQITPLVQVSSSVITKITAILAAPSPRIVTSIPILYYHSVAIEPGNPLRMPPKQFEEQMKYLAGQGYEVLSENQFYEGFSNKIKLLDKSVVITFDDGYDDNFTNAFPIMQKYQFVGTVFIPSSYINGPGYLTSDQLEKLQAAGWTIGGHSQNHTNLEKVSTTVAAQEIITANRTLKKLLGHPVTNFAYPYGGYSPDVANLVHKYGCRTAYTTQKGWAKVGGDPLSLPRVYCYANMGIQEFARRLTYFDY